MEEIVPHCQSCSCFKEKEASIDPLGKKILRIAKYRRPRDEFRSLALKFIADKGLSLSSVYKDIGIGRQAFENFIYKRKNPQFRTIAKIFKYMKDNGLEL